MFESNKFDLAKLAETAANERRIADKIAFAVSRFVNFWTLPNGDLGRAEKAFVKNRLKTVDQLRKSAEQLEKIVAKARK
jgi:hypothetical protein